MCCVVVVVVVVVVSCSSITYVVQVRTMVPFRFFLTSVVDVVLFS